jgi:hypothetical protein
MTFVASRPKSIPAIDPAHVLATTLHGICHENQPGQYLHISFIYNKIWQLQGNSADTAQHRYIKTFYSLTTAKGNLLSNRELVSQEICVPRSAGI